MGEPFYRRVEQPSGIVTFELVESLGPGGGPGGLTVHKFPFAFDTPGLADGIEVYTPASGELLMDAWISVTEGWDGGTAQADIGCDLATPGIVSFGGATWQLDASRASELVAGMLISVVAGLNPPLEYAGEIAEFVSTDPLKLVVSTDGTTGGSDPGADQGSAVLYFVTAGPA